MPSALQWIISFVLSSQPPMKVTLFYPWVFTQDSDKLSHMVKCWDLNSSQSWHSVQALTSASQIFFILPFTFLYKHDLHNQKERGEGQRSLEIMPTPVLDLFGGICPAICPGPPLYSGAGMGRNLPTAPTHTRLMDRKASGLWVAHHWQADNLMPGLVDHFTPLKNSGTGELSRPGCSWSRGH